jgi:multicomponent Na+:H+ antiporter subunit G
MAIVSVISGACLLIGLLFNTLGVIGILRFPDVYTRLHADTKATTFGSIFTSLSVIVYALAQFIGGGDKSMLVLALHVGVAVFVLAFTNAVGAHAIAQAAHRSGVKPSPSVKDDLEEAGE